MPDSYAVMTGSISTILAILLKSATVMLVFNEIRGLILAAPVLYGMYQAGGSLMAIWIGFCSLAGIALSVIVPMAAASRIGKLMNAREV